MSNPCMHTNANGTKYWYLNGELHREDGPAVEYANGEKQCWYQNGALHREDGPAIEYANGDKYWYQNGELHCKDGPAIEYANGDKYWYLNGKEYTQIDFNKQLKGKRMNAITKDEAVQKIKDSKGRIFTVTFVKKTDGQTRKMNCRLGVKKDLKGTGRKIDTSKFIGVFDLQKNDYRVINIEGIQALKVNGEEFTVDDTSPATPVTVAPPVTKTPSVLQYSVAEGKTVQDLKTEVISYISKGWKPIGGITLGVQDSSGYVYNPRYLQSMIKE